MAVNRNMQGILDRFEGDWAVIESRQKMIRVKRQELPAEAVEGDLLSQQSGTWMIDKEASSLRKKQIKKLADELWEDQDS